MREMPELTAVEAVTHPEPYAWYEALAHEQPFAFDERLGLWVAASAEAVEAVLTSTLCRVRPTDEPIPAALVGSAAGAVFGALVRMSDGETHQRLKRAVATALATVDPEQAHAESAAWARELWPLPGSGHVLDFACALPVHVLGSLLGVARAGLPQLVEWVRDFAACIAPGGAAASAERGAKAASELQALFQALLGAEPSGLLAALAAAARAEGCTSADVTANALGLLFQSFDATAALIGNSVVALGTDPNNMAALRAEPDRIRTTLLDVLRLDAPIQNTRRCVTHDGRIAGQQVRAGAGILVVLAAASRDERRSMSGGYAFGAGAHACPGSALALAIAEAAVARLLETDGAPALPRPVRYRASANARLPLLEGWQ